MSNRKSHTSRHAPKLSRTMAAMFANADINVNLLPPTPSPGQSTEFRANRKFRRTGKF